MRYPKLAQTYSKAADLATDLPQLTAWGITLAPGVLDGQHAIREWEYRMALHAIRGWQDWRHLTEGAVHPVPTPLEILDVGGAGSQFWQALRPYTGESPVLVVDAAGPDRVWRDGEPVQYWPESLEQFATYVRHQQFDILTAISVVEHVVEVRKFLRACHMLLKPGGLLFLTTDYWDAEGEDTAHFHWMRERIYNAERIRKLGVGLREIGFRSFGEADWGYKGPQVFDYSVCSVAMVKK